MQTHIPSAVQCNAFVWLGSLKIGFRLEWRLVNALKPKITANNGNNISTNWSDSSNDYGQLKNFPNQFHSLLKHAHCMVPAIRHSSSIFINCVEESGPACMCVCTTIVQHFPSHLYFGVWVRVYIHHHHHHHQSHYNCIHMQHTDQQRCALVRCLSEHELRTFWIFCVEFSTPMTLEEQWSKGNTEKIEIKEGRGGKGREEDESDAEDECRLTQLWTTDCHTSILSQTDTPNQMLYNGHTCNVFQVPCLVSIGTVNRRAKNSMINDDQAKSMMMMTIYRRRKRRCFIGFTLESPTHWVKPCIGREKTEYKRFVLLCSSEWSKERTPQR